MLSKLAKGNSLLIRSQIRRLTTEADAKHGHTPNPEFWKKVFLFVSVPAIILSGINTYIMEMEHFHHYHRPEFIPYEHLRIRTHKFPWGDGNHSLFHNPKVNPLPEGWEELD